MVYPTHKTQTTEATYIKSNTTAKNNEMRTTKQQHQRTIAAVEEIDRKVLKVITIGGGEGTM